MRYDKIRIRFGYYVDPFEEGSSNAASKQDVSRTQKKKKKKKKIKDCNIRLEFACLE